MSTKKKSKNLKKIEEEYKALFNNGRDIIVVFDKKGVIIDVSRAIKNITGLSPKEMKGHHFRELKYVASKTKEIMAEHFRKSLKGIEGYPFEIEVFAKDGRKLVFEVNVAPFLRGNEIIGSLVILRDITKHKRIEEMLSESADKLRSVINSSPNAITVTDLKGKIIDCNQAALDMHGFSEKKELIGKSALDLIAPKDHLKASENLKKTLKKGVLKNIEYTFLTKDGREFPAELSASIIRDSSGKPTAFMAITEDISERKKMEETRQKFIEIATHQLRSPLVSCRWTLALLKRRFMTSLGLEGAEYLEQMGEHIEKLLSLAKDLLNTSKIESGVLKPNIKEIYLDDFLSSIIQANQAYIHRKRIKIKENFKKGGRILIKSDLEKLDDIIDNLLNNAIKFSRKNSEIQIGARRSKKYIVIYIKDEGIGVPEKDGNKIFRRFFRARNAVEAGIKGNGLGLFVAKKYAEFLGGVLYFKSQQDKGSTFFLKIPNSK